MSFYPIFNNNPFQYFYLNPSENVFVIHHVQKLKNENVNITIVLCNNKN